MASQVDWVQSLDRMTSILFRIFMAYRSRKKEADEEGKKAVTEQFRRDMHFLVRRLADPEFARHISAHLDYTRQGTKRRGVVVERNMKLLADFVLEDVAAMTRKEWATANHILPHSTYQPPESPVQASGHPAIERSYGRFHELINEFPELLYTTEEIKRGFRGKKFAGGRRTGDRKERVIGTPFSSPQNLDPVVFVRIMMAAFREDYQGEALRSFLIRAITQMAETDRIEITNPVETRKIALFQRYVEGLMAKLELMPPRPPSGEGEKLGRSFVMLVSKLLFFQTRTLAELHWFQGLSIERQKKLIFREPAPLKPLTRRAARVCIAEVQRLAGDDREVFFLIQHAIEPLLEMNQFSSVEELLRASLGRLQLSTEERALTLEALATAYREQAKVNLQREALLESLNLWKQLGGHPGDQAVDYAYLAELSRVEGDFAEYDSRRSDAEKLASSDELTLTRQANIALYMADCAEIYGDVSWELRILDRGLRIAAKDKNLLNFFEFFDQCIGDLKLNGKRGPDRGEGRVGRPPQIRSETMSGVFEVVFDDLDFGN